MKILVPKEQSQMKNIEMFIEKQWKWIYITIVYKKVVPAKVKTVYEKITLTFKPIKMHENFKI